MASINGSMTKSQALGLDTIKANTIHADTMRVCDIRNTNIIFTPKGVTENVHDNDVVLNCQDEKPTKSPGSDRFDDAIQRNKKKVWWKRWLL